MTDNDDVCAVVAPSRCQDHSLGLALKDLGDERLKQVPRQLAGILKGQQQRRLNRAAARRLLVSALKGVT